MKEEVRKNGRAEGKENSVSARLFSVILKASSEQSPLKELIASTKSQAKQSSTFLSFPTCQTLTASPEIAITACFFYTWDHLGTVRLITDSSANIVSKHDFEPYGVELPSYNDSSGSTHKFTGHERDTSTGYDYMHFRFYASSMGRFLKPDNIIPDITNPQNWNAYTYVKGNPVNFNDPSGHTEQKFMMVNKPEEGNPITGEPDPNKVPKEETAKNQEPKKVSLTIVLKANSLTPLETTVAKEAIKKELNSCGIDVNIVTKNEISLLKNTWLRIKAIFGGNVSFVDVKEGFAMYGNWEKTFGEAAVPLGGTANMIYLGPARKTGFNAKALGNYVANVSLHEIWHHQTGIHGDSVDPNVRGEYKTIMSYPNSIQELAVPLHYSKSDAEKLFEALQ